MKNNDILRSLRYTFDFDDDTMIKIFAEAELGVTRAEVCDWLKTEEDPEYKPINDFKLATFLNGLINYKRGKKEGKQPVPESKLTNNLIFKKLKIALTLTTEDMLQILEKADRKISPHELSAFFRRPEQSQYRLCKDQIMRNFLHGLQLVYRGN